MLDCLRYMASSSLLTAIFLSILLRNQILAFIGKTETMCRSCLLITLDHLNYHWSEEEVKRHSEHPPQRFWNWPQHQGDNCPKPAKAWRWATTKGAQPTETARGMPCTRHTVLLQPKTWLHYPAFTAPGPKIRPNQPPSGHLLPPHYVEDHYLPAARRNNTVGLRNAWNTNKQTTNNSIHALTCGCGISFLLLRYLTSWLVITLLREENKTIQKETIIMSEH